MINPILVETLRGAVVENFHRGAIAVIDADGNDVIAIGDIDRPVFPRSSIKSIIALPLVESGAAEAFNFGSKEIALASSSHSGEEAHRMLAHNMLKAAGQSEHALECGPTWPYGEQGTSGPRDYAASGNQPARICHNCSGKHAGMICTANHLGLPHSNYVDPNHLIQQEIKAALEDITGAEHSEAMRGVDGCSVPNYAIPLKNLALGMARMMTGQGIVAGRAHAAQKIVSACMADPFYVAGTGRVCTRLMSAAPGEIFAKYGADGVYALGLPKLGLGVGLKVDDGTPRAAEAMAAGILAQLLPNDHHAQPKLEALAAYPIHAASGEINGSVRFKPEV